MMRKAARFARLPLLMGTGVHGGSSQAFFPVLFAGGFLGHYLGDGIAFIDEHFMRGGSIVRYTGTFFVGMLVGVGIGFAVYPQFQPWIEEAKQWIISKTSGEPARNGGKK